MDEPYLFLRDGAGLTQIPLTELCGMFDAATELAEGALAQNPQAIAAAEMVARTAAVYGPQRGKASVSMFLLQHAMARIEERKQKGAIVVAPQSVAGTVTQPAAAAEGGTATPSPVAVPPGPAAGPCSHPPDIACPNCATAHMEARNAKKRAGARA